MSQRKALQEREGALSRMNVRIEPRLGELLVELVKQSGAPDRSEYIRGLIIAEALAAEMEMKGISLPGWLIGKKVFVTGENSEHSSRPVQGKKKD